MKSLRKVGVPEHGAEALCRYVEEGVPPGSFLRAVLEDRLVEAYVYADQINRAAFISYPRALYSVLPRECWGSPEVVDAWIQRGGRRGKGGRP